VFRVLSRVMPFKRVFYGEIQINLVRKGRIDDKKRTIERLTRMGDIKMNVNYCLMPSNDFIYIVVNI